MRSRPRPIHRRSREAHFYVGQWHLLRGRQRAAKTSFQAVAAHCPRERPEYAIARAELRQLSAWRARLRRSRDRLARLWATPVDRRFDSQLPLYYCVFPRHAKADLIHALVRRDAAICFEPTSAHLRISRGLVWHAAGHPGRAIIEYNEAIGLSPGSAVAFRHRGNSWRARGDFERAVDDFNEALRLDPQDADAYADRGHVFSTTGDLAARPRRLQHGAGAQAGPRPRLASHRHRMVRQGRIRHGGRAAAPRPEATATPIRRCSVSWRGRAPARMPPPTLPPTHSSRARPGRSR